MIEAHEGLNWPRWKRLVRHVEALGFDGLFRSDHFTQARPVDADSLELWTSLCWLADHTGKLAFGPLVAPVSFRHPTHLVREATALDDLSGGRLVLGLGAGWQEREHRMFGWPLLPRDERFARFDEALQVVTALLRTPGPVSFDGRFYHLEEAVLRPRPQRPQGPPILIGGNGPRRTLPLAALYADEWNAVFVSPHRFRTLNARLDELLDAAGRPRHAVKRSTMAGMVFGPSEALLRERIGPGIDQYRTEGLIAATPETISGYVEAFKDAGVERLILQWIDMDDLQGLEILAQCLLRDRRAAAAVPCGPLAQSMPASGIRAVFDRSAARTDVISLALGQPDLETPEVIRAAARAAIDEGYNRYTPTAGLPETRVAIARKIERDLGLRYDPATQIIVTGGAINALSLALMSILSPGDQVIITDPGYTAFEPCIRMAGGAPVRVPLRAEHGFRLQAEDVAAVAGARTRALIVNSPCNPTGSVLSRADLEALAGVARRHDLVVLSDEVYEKFVYDGQVHHSIAACPGMQDRTVIINSFSKTCLICGWRIGFAAAPAGLVSRMVAVQQAQVVSAPSVAQRAVVAALDDMGWVVPMRDEYRTRRDYLVEALNRIPGVRCHQPEGAFYVYADVSGYGPCERTAWLLGERAGVLTVPGTAFGPRGEGFLRISYALPVPDLEKAIGRVDAFFKSLQQQTAGPQAEANERWPGFSKT